MQLYYIKRNRYIKLKDLKPGNMYVFIMGKNKIRCGKLVIPEKEHDWYMEGNNGRKYTPYLSDVLSGILEPINLELNLERINELLKK